MNGLRRLLLRHRRMFAWLLVASLAVKLIVPTGFMLVISPHAITIELCGSYGAPMMMAGDMADGRSDHHQPDKAQAPCPFALLSVPALAATDLLLLTVAAALLIATAFRAAPAFAVQRSSWLRPPPQGPPRTI